VSNKFSAEGSSATLLFVDDIFIIGKANSIASNVNEKLPEGGLG